MHCTQGGEASHKVNMHLASLRARHLDSNYTQFRMFTYLLWYQVFNTLNIKPEKAVRNTKPGLSLLLRIPCVVRKVCSKFATVRFQREFLHQQVRIAGVEFLNLLCVQFELPQTRTSFIKLQSLHFTLGQKYTRDDRKTFWSTDTRRDILRLQGHDSGTSFCCETICFIRVDNTRCLSGGSLPDTLHLVLVRWFSPHDTAWERDVLHRPLCPGPLSINNCLWTYSRTPAPRRALVNQSGQPSEGFKEQDRLFGKTQHEISESWNREKHAYYGLISPDNIVGTVNMAPTFQNRSSVPDYSCWLETVILPG